MLNANVAKCPRWLSYNTIDDHRSNIRANSHAIHSDVTGIVVGCEFSFGFSSLCLCRHVRHSLHIACGRAPCLCFVPTNWLHFDQKSMRKLGNFVEITFTNCIVKSHNSFLMSIHESWLRVACWRWRCTRFFRLFFIQQRPHDWCVFYSMTNECDGAIIGIVGTKATIQHEKQQQKQNNRQNWG